MFFRASTAYSNFLKALAITILLLSSFSANGQSVPRRITGTVLEEDTLLPMVQAAVQLLNPKDSSGISGTVTDTEGKFIISADSGDFLLKLSMLGFQSKMIPIHKASAASDLNLGNIALTPESTMLRNSTVSAKAPVATVIADTVVYNPAAFRLAEDAMLDDLLKKIPGLEINGGSVTLHGKTVTQLYVNGRKFFGGDVKNGLKSLPADMVDRVHAYERESDFARISGIDDGEREPTIDVKIKKKMMGAWRDNIQLGIGTEGRYNASFNANKVNKKDQMTIIAKQHNRSGEINIQNTSRSQTGSGSAGDRTSRELGFTFAKDTKKTKFNGHIHYNGSDRFADLLSRTESITPSSHSYTNYHNTQDNFAHTLKGDLIAEWTPNRKNIFYFKPEFNINYSGNYTNSLGNYLTKDPYSRCSSPFDYLVFYEPGETIPSTDSLKSIRSNSSNNLTNVLNFSAKAQMVFQYTHRFAKRGRTISFRTQDYWQRTDKNEYLSYLTRYYFIKKNRDSLLVRKLHTDTGTDFVSLMGQISYNEPLGKKNHLQFTVRQEYRSSRQTKDLFNFSALAPDWLPALTCLPSQGNANLPQGYEGYRADNLSYDGLYQYWATCLTLNYRYVTKKFNCTLGANIRPQGSKLTYFQNGSRQEHNLRFFNASPNVVIKYKPEKNTQFSFNYGGWASTPGMYELMPVESGTNPLYLHIGNPDLKAAFTHNISCSFNRSDVKKQNSILFNAGAKIIEDQVVTAMEYNDSTGVRTSRSANIDGNWRINGSLVFNQTFKDNRFSISSHTAGEYQNNVSYLYNTKTRVDEVNNASRLMIKEQLDGCYRNDWLEFTLRGRGEYTKEHSRLRPDMDQEPLLFAAGFETVCTFGWKMRLSAEFMTMFQRGFTYDELNRNYYVLNIGIAQPLLKKKLTLRVDAFDVLRQLDNMTRSFGVQSRNVSIYNGVNSYILFRAIYRFKVGGKKSQAKSK